MIYINRKRVTIMVALLTSSAFAQEASAPPKVANAFNPDISANFLGLAQYGSTLSSNRTNSDHDGLSLQEAEFQFTSDVDAYFKASALFSISQKDGSKDYGIDPEEVFLETTFIPNLTLKAGKFKAYLGKHNQLHTHAYPFIDAPLISQALLGKEGLNEVGASAAYLIPILPWYSEITLQGLSTDNDDIFNSSSSKQIAALAHYKNLWDLSDDLTMELGLSGVEGRNDFEKSSYLMGSDLTFKWRPANGGKYHALIWSTEYLYGDHSGKKDPTTTDSLEKLGGIASWLQYQFAQRWWVETRYEYVGLPKSQALTTQQKESALIGFFPSEFSGFRLQYAYLTTEHKAKGDHYVGFQYNISIGAHPAHAY